MKRPRATSKQEKTVTGSAGGSNGVLALVLLYTAVVLLVDTLAARNVTTPIHWRIFSWHARNGADLFKLMAWFVIPFLFSLRRFDWGWLGTARWKRIDAIILGVLAAVCAGAVLAIPLFPSLRHTYGSVSHAAAASKWSYATHNVVWTFSWLVGWEFLHRCVLLRALSARWPRWGWLLIPVFEGVYHLQKPLIEALGMVVFSCILTPWAQRRRNVLLPFLAHLAIELELIVFLVAL